MRETKFRGKDLQGNWRYGSLLLATDRWYKHKNGSGFHKEWIASRTFSNGGYIAMSVRNCVKPETVGQFIGLHDKKGKEIYEGDILYVEFSDGSGGNHLVGWNDKTASYGIMDAYSYQSIAEGYDFAEFKNHVLLAFLKDALICEVVGNIHDNPELLKK